MNYYEAPTLYGHETNGGTFDPCVFQGETPACAVYSQYNVLKDYGYEGSAEDLIQEATNNGWYSPESGTPVEHIGKLLESHGVPCDMYLNANKYNLIDALAHGKKVIVTVDAGELWYNEGPFSDFFERIFGGGENHALVVTGIDTADPNNITVTLTDSGTGQEAVSYPLAKFEDAWSDGHCKMIVPRDPPPQSMGLASLANFDYSTGHIAAIGDVPYSEWISDPEHMVSWEKVEFEPDEIEVEHEFDPLVDSGWNPNDDAGVENSVAFSQGATEIPDSADIEETVAEDIQYETDDQLKG